jgi:hypothetical protein
MRKGREKASKVKESLSCSREKGSLKADKDGL